MFRTKILHIAYKNNTKNRLNIINKYCKKSKPVKNNFINIYCDVCTGKTNCTCCYHSNKFCVCHNASLVSIRELDYYLNKTCFLSILKINNK